MLWINCFLLLSLVLRSSKLISPQFPSLLLSFPEIKLCWVFCYDVNFQQDNDFPSSVFPNSWHNICFENMMPSILVPRAPSPNVYVKAFLTNGACKADFYSSIWRDQPNFAVTNSDNATCKKEKRVFWNYIQLRTWLIILMIHFEEKKSYQRWR